MTHWPKVVGQHFSAVYSTVVHNVARKKNILLLKGRFILRSHQPLAPPPARLPPSRPPPPARARSLAAHVHKLKLYRLYQTEKHAKTLTLQNWILSIVKMWYWDMACAQKIKFKREAKVSHRLDPFRSQIWPASHVVNSSEWTVSL